MGNSKQLRAISVVECRFADCQLALFAKCHCTRGLSCRLPFARYATPEVVYRRKRPIDRSRTVVRNGTRINSQMKSKTVNFLVLLSLYATCIAGARRRQSSHGPVIFPHDDPYTCDTPLNHPGMCVSIEHCPQLRLVGLRRLSKFICGFDHDTPLLCCETSSAPAPPFLGLRPLSPPPTSTSDNSFQPARISPFEQWSHFYSTNMHHIQTRRPSLQVLLVRCSATG
ncbi:uncharacterized protein LOC111259563 [Varroa jacobsoni]|uniref:uncharacterized protein LOC111259563 n=1 Tax=Varroa jacobsoni TaxID=62625 RepID=UPI000BF4A9E5|nr:uncharacterized protein LOC111259563 [Varroa jacobsoni]